MNQDQRKFLIAQVEKTYRLQKDKIESKKPIRPSLNNYLIAAFLDNSIQFNDIDSLKKKMRNTVLKYGAADKLIEEEDSWNKRGKDNKYVKILPEDLFVIPENYKKALSEYESEKKDIDNKIELLEAQKETIIMKIQIGSNAVLDKLIVQVDNMADLSIMNSQLLLTD